MRRGKLPNKEIAERFDRVAETFDKISNEYTVTRRYGEILKHIHGRCLEVGAATVGIISKHMGKNHVVTDISYKMCRVASAKNKERSVCCDAEKLPFRSETFDTIVSSEVIYYLNDPELFIKESYRLLRKNGKLVISSANQDMQIYDKLRKFARKMGIKRMYFDDPINTFMRLEDIEKLLRKSNFRIKESRKIVLLPFKRLHGINKIAEKTFLKHMGIFIFVVAKKE